MSDATMYSLSLLCANIMVASEEPTNCSNSWARPSEKRQTPLKGGPPKNLEPVHNTTRPLSKFSRTSPSPSRPWHASTTGRTNLPYSATRRSRQSAEGMHCPVLLPTTMCTTTHPYFGLPSSPKIAKACRTASSTSRSRSCSDRRRPRSSRMERVALEKAPASGLPSAKPKTRSPFPQFPGRPEGNRLAKCWPMAASIVPEPTSPAAVTTLKTSWPRPFLGRARRKASRAGSSSASVPEGKRLMMSSNDRPKTARRRSRMSHSSFLNRSSGEE
mmetsp:Transcript_147277/g.473096  ORF Transcript_147277/g.473096 Transcript_147277/m.473096 type:complete len:273 (+) Transcript_147277:1191-2009(+)